MRERFDVYTAPTLRELVVRLIEVFADADASFLSKLAALDDKRWMEKPLKLRHYVAASRDHLYIDSAHLTEENSVQVRGYWVITNIGQTEVSTFFKLCSEVAGVPLLNLSKIPI
ncbi:MAG: hypothetical protein HY067_16175 [Betaproteobacteria bacterium]|nr:hypothetical protein [Betaproteobacteria bacterium]